MELHTGKHWVVHYFGLAFHMDTIITTWIVSAIIIIVTLLATRQRKMVPTGIQNVVEYLLETLADQFKGLLGEKWASVSSVLFTFFIFILVSNELGLVPSAHLIASPTNDINTALALALASSTVVTVMGIRFKGKAYFKHFIQPYKVFIFINIIEEITKPLTLAMRLFGNIMAGEILLELLYELLPPYLPMASIWIFMSLVIGIIQAFIFTVLTTSYLGMLVGDEH